MKIAKKIIILICMILILFFQAARANVLPENKYDLVLLRIEREKEMLEKRNKETRKQGNKETREQSDKEAGKQRDNEGEYEPQETVLSFEHSSLPILDGTWKIRKKTVKKGRVNLIKEIARVTCNSRLPIAEREFESDIVISPQGEDLFVFRSLYPTVDDPFIDSKGEREVDYQVFGFKGVVVPNEITYAYTLKLKDHKLNTHLFRQMYLQGRLFLDKISGDKITAKGYELVSSPECLGFVKDEIEFEIVKVKQEVASAE